MNTNAEPRSGASVDPSHKSVAPVKKRALEPSRRLLVLRQPQRLRHGRRGRYQRQRNWCADIAAAMTSRHPSRNDATPAAAPASSSAMARPRGTRRPRPLGRRKPQSSFGRRSKSDRDPGSSKGSGLDLSLRFETRSKNQRQLALRYRALGRASELFRLQLHVGRADNRPRYQPGSCSLS